MSENPRLLGDRYEVGALIGRGGMAEVHEGYDTRLGRKIAIKLLRSDLARDQSFLARFRREAQSAAGLNHPSIVAIFDSGEDTMEDAAGARIAVPYIVMEFVDGRTLRSELDEVGHFSPTRAAQVTEGVLDALAYSHKMGIVHRDIKPANVMIARSGAVKVMDFGIARALADTAATMTQANAVVGTAQYLSPEQAQGKQVDARSDLYSTGCLLFELLTGRVPFVGDSPVSIAYQHVGEQPAPPSNFAPAVSPSLDAVTLHALSKNREDRYATADEFRDDLVAARSGRPISAAALASLGGAAAAAAAATSVFASNPAEDGAAATTQALPQLAPAVATPPATSMQPATRRPAPKKKKNNGWLYALGSFFAVLALVGGALLINNLLNPTPVDTTRAVPQIDGLPAAQAKASLINAGLNPVPTNVAGDVPKGEVFDQNPAAGRKVKGGSDVTYKVSTGPDSTTVPDLVGLSKTNAEQTLKLQELKVTKFVVDDSPDQDKDYVLSTEPKAGQPIKIGQGVIVHIASGKTIVPDVRGKDVNVAVAEFYKNKLTMGTPQYVETADKQPGTVLDQSMQPRESVPFGTTITLKVAQAPAQTITETPPQPSQ